MKKLFQTKYLTMICFLALLAIMFSQSISPVYKGFLNTAKAYQDTGNLNFSIVEETYNSNFKGKYFFITLNGAYQNMMGARTINERYKLDNGHLTYVVEECDVENIARNTIQFNDALKKLNIPFVYVNTPFKIHQTDKQLPVNIQDFSNENADCFLDYLKNEKVTVLDLRENIAKAGLDHYDMFYKTDHHWKAEAGLWAAGEISGFLAALDDRYQVEKERMNPDSYAFEVYEDIFLGSAGRRVGRMYAGMDDFTVITPLFETSLCVSTGDDDAYREGSFSDVFIDREQLYPDNLFISNVYATYGCSGFGHMEIYNHKTISNPSCTSKNILIIRDSYSDVLIPFLSLGYEHLDVIDLRYFDKNLMDYIEKSSPDIVLVVYNPGAYEHKNYNMFDFLNESGNAPS